MTSSAFLQFQLHPELLSNLDSLGYLQPTPIQAESLPPILAGSDVIAQAKTGSGKTAAFGLGVLQKLQVKRFRVQTLILCPTRELADQVAKELRKLARAIHNIKILTLCGGTPMGPQIGSLEHGAHIIVGTPGRIEDHVRKGRLNLEEVSTLVLDEADRMLDMGFQESLENIISLTPSSRQSLLFSATFPAEIERISKDLMRKPVRIVVQDAHSKSSIDERFYKVASHDSRLEALLLILHEQQAQSAMVFCITKQETQDIADQLREHGFAAVALHGDMDQKDRDRTLIRFANMSARVLVATDVAARGLDIDTVDLVVNYQISRDVEVHTHRIGRTGRAGGFGVACTLFTEREQHRVQDLEIESGLDAEIYKLPSNAVLSEPIVPPEMVTLQVDGGKRDKIRPGDILGALTSDGTLTAKQVGKINIMPTSAFIAVHRSASKKALEKLSSGKIKGRSFKARLVRR